VLAPALKDRPERDVAFTTVSDLPIERLYTAEDVAGRDPAREIGLPGEPPYTRGIHPSMYRGRVWTMRQFAGFGSARDTNERFRYLLDHGQTGLSTAFDLPTLMGRDSRRSPGGGRGGARGRRHRHARGHGDPVLRHPLGRVSTSMTINAPAVVFLAMYLAVAEKQGVPFASLEGTIQNDILKEYIAQKEWIYPPAASMRIITDMIDFCTARVPKWNTISISGYHIREAGSTAVQELAFTLSTPGVRPGGVDRGLPVDAFAPRLSFFFNSHIDFFEEIAKLRAARRMWCRFMQEALRRPEPALLDPADARPDRAARSRPSSRTTTSSGSPSRPWPRRSVARSPAHQFPRRDPWRSPRRSRSASPCGHSRSWRRRAA